ncbi:sugar ABC transporter substrate-binding protein [Gordonia McavH-238-E]|uniref:sugar ABC transporter substrate-binding protein n=1 Tax=Gordonia sp. McavH-238-E TaxID=2917736 RepID=UPI001EF61BE7|nr:sugar ABC transporter substrate-binding protein [Gordonia sp. McavH-238-E]MCG7635157.1 sugar ABC transporter substrate-binding protein [Gordonia sp. McavH-238-E]
MPHTHHVRPLRRCATLVVAAALGAAALVGCGSQDGSTTGADDLLMVSEVRSLTNPYEAAWVEGSKAYAESVGVDLKVIVYGGDSQNALSQLQSVLATGKKVLLNINPNTSADTPAIVRAVQNSGGCAVTQWSKPADLHPWDVGDGWASYVSYDGVKEGADTGDVLGASIGGQGGVIAIQGLLANDISKTRYQGFTEGIARHPGVVVLDNQPADFDRNKAYTTTQTLLNKYGDKVNGIWAATDSMALGALQAVREKGKAGQIKVASAADATPEGLQAIEAGEMVSTYTTDPYFNGAMGLAICHQVATGQLKVSDLSRLQREFYVDQTLITSDNAARYLERPTDEEIVESVRDPFSRIVGPIDPDSLSNEE